MQNLYGIILSYVYIGILFVISNFIGKNNKEISRKFIHISLAGYWIIAMFFFNNVICASIVPASFVLINTLSYKFNLIKSMEREEQDGFGTIYYAIAILVLSIITFGIINKPIVGLAGMFVMCFGDGLAAIFGKKFGNKKYKIGNTTKSYLGSFTMLVITFGIVFAVFSYLGTTYNIAKSILIAVIATILEAVSIKGTDNITVPLLTSSLVFFLI